MMLRSNGLRRFGRIIWNHFRVGIYAIPILFCFTGCERDVDIKLNDEAAKLVVEATIENGHPPVVFLSKSLNFFSQISPALLEQSLVHDADVYVSNGSKTQKLKEYRTPVGAGFNISFYTVDSSNLSSAFFGEINHQYDLRIVADGKEYKATTTIPQLTKRLDSVWWRKAPPQADSDQVNILIRATDPPGFGDYVRYYTRRNSEPFFAPANATFDDFFVDGTTYELPIERGNDRNIKITDRERFFLKGDTVTLKLCNIDRATYDFWRTMEFSYQSVGNPFSTPTKVLSNISGDALGYFGGFACQYQTVIVPK